MRAMMSLTRAASRLDQHRTLAPASFAQSVRQPASPQSAEDNRVWRHLPQRLNERLTVLVMLIHFAWRIHATVHPENQTQMVMRRPLKLTYAIE